MVLIPAALPHVHRVLFRDVIPQGSVVMDALVGFEGFGGHVRGDLNGRGFREHGVPLARRTHDPCDLWDAVGGSHRVLLKKYAGGWNPTMIPEARLVSRGNVGLSYVVIFERAL